MKKRKASKLTTARQKDILLRLLAVYRGDYGEEVRRYL